jgi:hypothetical protein
MRTISCCIATIALLTIVGSGTARSEKCDEWPNYKPATAGAVTAKAMLDDIRKIAKEALKKDGACSTDSDPQTCRRQWTAVLGAERRVTKKGKDWEHSCDDQWKNVEAALASAKAGKPVDCFGSLDYEKGD